MVHIYIKKKLSKVFYLNCLFKFEFDDLFYLNMKYSPRNFLISNNLFATLKNI